MARTTITPQNPAVGNGYPALPLAADAAELAFVAGDVANGNDFVTTGREIVLVWNTSADTAYDFTVTPAADRFGRVGTSIVHEVDFAAVSMFGPFPLEGWRQTDGKIWLAVENAALTIAVVRLPSIP